MWYCWNVINYKKDVGVYIYDALTIIQHRGQDAAGITTASKGRFYMRKGNGMVRNVFRTKHITKLIGDMGLDISATQRLEVLQELKLSPFM